jgi:CrcB protein
MTVVLVAVAGAAGALLRFGVDHVVQHRRPSVLPVGILVVNVSGAFALGVLTSANAHHAIGATALVVSGTGFLGAYTTFSSFTFDTFRLATDGRLAVAAANLLLAVVLGLGAAAAGLALGALT